MKFFKSNFCLLLFIFESGSWYVAQASPEYTDSGGCRALVSCYSAWCDMQLLHATIELLYIQCLAHTVLIVTEEKFARQITEQKLLSTEDLLLCKLVCLL